MTYGSKEDDSAYFALSPAEHNAFKSGFPVKKRTGDFCGEYDIVIQLLPRQAINAARATPTEKKKIARLIKQVSGVVMEPSTLRLRLAEASALWSCYGQKPGVSWRYRVYSFHSFKACLSAPGLFIPDEGPGLDQLTEFEVAPLPLNPKTYGRKNNRRKNHRPHR